MVPGQAACAVLVVDIAAELGTRSVASVEVGCGDGCRGSIMLLFAASLSHLKCALAGIRSPSNKLGGGSGNCCGPVSPTAVHAWILEWQPSSSRYSPHGRSSRQLRGSGCRTMRLHS